MRHRTLAATASILILIGLLLSSFSPVVARQAGQLGFEPPIQSEFKAGEVLVKLREDLVSEAIVDAIRSRTDAVRARVLYKSNVEVWQVPEGREQAIVEELNANPAVEYAELNHRYYILGIPNDPRYDDQWAHEIMGSAAAWDLTTGSSAVIIAIIDSGIDENHPDLRDKIVAGYDFVDDDTTPHDLNGHGTHCAGIAAALTNNLTGVAGMDWQARIMPVRAMDADGGGYVSDLAAGIRWAYEHGADVISLSLGGLEPSQTLENAVNDAHAAGSLIVAAMGNYRLSAPSPYPPNPTMYPAANDNVMAVAATTRDDVYAYYSQYGPHCDIAAPGGEMTYLGDPDGILSTLPTYDGFYLQTEYGHSKNYHYLQGTSMATPYVAGLAALVWSLNPSLTPNEVQTTLQITAEDLGALGKDQDYGWGRIDAYRAVLAHLPPTLQPISNPDGDGNYTIQWTAVPAASAYTLEEDDNGAFSSPTVRYSGLNEQYSVTNRPGGTWYYRVRATGIGGDGGWSNVRSTTVKPAAPTLYSISNSSPSDEYQIRWSTATGATGYTLEEDNDPSFPSPETRYVGTSPSYNVTGQPGGTWHYRVKASNAAGESAPSNVQSTVVAASLLSAPTLLPIDNADGDDSYLVDWDYAGSVTSTVTFVLEESANAYFATPTAVYEGGPSQFEVTGQPGGTWYYRVRAIESPTATSPWSNIESSWAPTWVYLPLILDNVQVAVTDVLVNGTFEQGVVGWVEYSSQDWPLILSTGLPITAHSGAWAVWFGGALNEVSYIEQQVTIPAETPHLHYWYWVGSSDDCGHDFASIRVNGTAAKVQDLCASENSSGWVEASADLSGYAGQSVSLRIHTTNDSSQTSSFFVDDVSLQASPVSVQAPAPGAVVTATLPTKSESDLQR